MAFCPLHGRYLVHTTLTMPMRVLIAEDEPRLAEALARGLRRNGFAVDVALDGNQALKRTSVVDYDVVVLDRDLPYVHGDEVCRQLVGAERPPRILMLTAAADVRARVEGLNLGADDYLTKPFAFAEVVARLHALQRRHAVAQKPVLERAGMCLDPARHEVTRDGRVGDAEPEGVRRAARPAARRRRGGQPRDAARARLGRARRPLHQHGAGDGDEPAAQARRPRP